MKETSIVSRRRSSASPTTPDADLVLNLKGIHVIPDILASAGEVTVSYFLRWSRKAIPSSGMKRAFTNVWTKN